MCSEVLEHKAKPRKKTEEISGLKLKFHNPIDMLLGWDHWSLLLEQDVLQHWIRSPVTLFSPTLKTPEDNAPTSSLGDPSSAAPTSC